MAIIIGTITRYDSAMKPRIHRNWRDAHPGDQFFSRLPYHRLEAIAGEMFATGYAYEFIAHPHGYMVRCVKSPLSLRRQPNESAH